ncbi:MAG: hypothetical protein LBT59_25690 [Clostridiales bacterium]|nr:hypothetical protein [Clostridiales bacterium]
MKPRPSDSEKDLLKVVKSEISFAKDTPSLEGEQKLLDSSIAESEALLKSLGMPVIRAVAPSKGSQPKVIKIRSFEDLLQDANVRDPGEVGFEDIFSKEELEANRKRIKDLNAEFDSVHRLGAEEIIIPVLAGILGAAFNCVLGGFVTNEDGKRVSGLSNYLFNKAFPKAKIKELEKMAMVTYDAANNQHTTVKVDTLSPKLHRLLSLGHDPILGFVVGVYDLLQGKMTTIDFQGNFQSQLMVDYSNRKAESLFEAISKVFIHMLSDVNTPAGLPVPFMALFNKAQTGAIGEEERNIAKLVKYMYGHGYDFRHFCSMSVSVMIIEVVVRVSYFAMRLADGCSVLDATPVGIDHEKKPKLATMLFLAHSASSAINAGKVVFTKNPLDINYPQWLAFAMYSVKQLKWVLVDKPWLREKYTLNAIECEWAELSASMAELWDQYEFLDEERV